MIVSILWLVKDPSLLLPEETIDVIGSAIVFLPHKGKYMQTFQEQSRMLPHLGLAGEIEVEGLRRKPALAVSDHLLSLVSGGLCLPLSDAWTVPPHCPP